MALGRLSVPDLHISVNPSVDEEEKSLAAVEYQGLDPDIVRALKVYMWDTASVFACASSFILMFYMREEFHKTGKYGYAWQNFFEGVISIVAVYPFALKSRFVNGDNHAEAIRKMVKSIPVYLPLNSLFQPTKDGLAAMSLSRSLRQLDFQEYANAAYDPLEVFSALAAYGLGFSATYYGLAKLMGVPATLLDTIKTGSQYYLSYLIGGVFNTDLTVGVSRLPNVLYSSLVLSGVNFAFDVLTNKQIVAALKHHHVMRRKQSRASFSRASDVSPATSPQAVLDEKSEPLLSSAEQAIALADEVKPPAKRWQKSCYEIMASYCFFAKKAENKPVSSAPVLVISSPLFAPGSR